MVYLLLYTSTLWIPSSLPEDKGDLSSKTPTISHIQSAELKPKCSDIWECFHLSPTLELAHTIVYSETETYPNDYRGSFIKEIAPSALLSARKHHLFPSIIIAQAILESGWGRSNLATKTNNLFGLKSRSKGYKTTTYESRSGKRVASRARFMVFPTWEDSVAYHGVLMGNSKRYKKAFSDSKTWRECIKVIAPRYASDPKYAKNIAILIRKYGLDRWDSLIRSYSM